MENIDSLIENILLDYDCKILEKIPKDCFVNPQYSKPLCCRFCGKSFPDVNFKNKAHVIPAFFGNKTILSECECDTCNSYFSQFETQLANYMNLDHVTAGVQSRSGKVPKYKQAGQITIENRPGYIFMSNLPEFKTLNLTEEGLILPCKKPSYIPEFIYRCLVKIAISILPESSLVCYNKTISWLMDVNLSSDIKPYMILSVNPIEVQLNMYALFERKSTCGKNVPFSIFYLAYNNFEFQISIPYTKKDANAEDLDLFPFIFQTSLNFIGIKQLNRTNSYVDLSSREKKTGEIVNVSVTGDYYVFKKKRALTPKAQ